MAKDPREMTDEELQSLVGGGTSSEDPDRKDPRQLSDEELEGLVEGQGSGWSMQGAKRALSNIGDAHLTGAKSALSGAAEGVIHLLAIPQDMANVFTQVLTNKRYLDGSDEAIKSLKSLGLDYDPEPNDFSSNVIKKTAELGSGAGATGFLLKSVAEMLQAGRYVPQVVTQAQSVFQRLMTEAANNPGLIQQEIKAGTRAGAAHGVLKQLWPTAPWWAAFMAELGGGMTANPRKPSPLSVAGQEERVANTVADLNANGRNDPGVDNKAGLQASLAEGRSRLTNPDGTPIVENFDPTSAQAAVTPTLLPDGSTAATRNLGPYEKASLGGSPELTTKLEGQARAINTATDQTFQNSNATPYEVDPSDAGQTIRQDLLAARQRQQAETENAYRNVNEQATTGVNPLVDDLITIRGSRNEADRPQDMPDEVEALLKTFEDKWPQDVLYKGQPLSYQDFLALRGKALATKDPQLLNDTDNLMGTYLAPEKQMGLLKDWRTRVMSELEKDNVVGKLKHRLGQVRTSIENAIDSFGIGTGSEADNFRTASKEARKLKETFDSGQVGAALEKEWGRHVLPDSDVPGKFTSANRQPESWNSLVAAAGDPSEATAAARRIVQQRFQAQTTNAPQTPEGVRTSSSEKFNNFLKNPDNKELIVNGFGQEHYDRLRQLEQMARVRETILKSPATAGSNSAEKLKALEQLRSGKELDKLFSSLTLRLGFVARAGRKATEMVYGDANQAMDRMFKDAMLDPDFLSGLLSRSRTREAFRARQKYRSYLSQQPAQVEKKLEDSKDERVDLSDLLASDMDARSTSAKYSAIDDLENSGWPNPRGYSTGGKIAKALGAKWFSPLEKAIEEAPEHLNHTLDNWIKYLRGRTTQHGNAPVKDEEIEAVWPAASKLAINPGPDEIYDPKSKFKKEQILEAVREANKHVELPEFQTYDPAKLEDLKYTEEGSPLAVYSRIMRSTPDSPVQFEVHEYADHPNRFSVIPGQGFGEPEMVNNSGNSSRSPLRFLLDQYNRNAGPKYGEHSSVRLPGGRDYKETVVGSPLSEPMSIDNAHFGSVPGVGQNQVGWTLHHNRFEEGMEPNLTREGKVPEPDAPQTFTDQDVIDRIRNEMPFMPEERRLNEDPADLWGRITEEQRQQARNAHANDTGRVWQQPERAVVPQGGDLDALSNELRQWTEQNGLPFESADELFARNDLDIGQQQWLGGFMDRWDRAAHAQDTGRVWQQPEPANNARDTYTDDDVIQGFIDAGMDEGDARHHWNAAPPEVQQHYRNQHEAARLQLEGERANQATQGNFPNHQPLGQGEWEVFDPADGRPVHLFETEQEARDFARWHNRFELDWARRGQGWAGNQPVAQQAKLPPPKPKEPTGAKVTFIDELQSYRHQKGANEGYRLDPKKREDMERALDETRSDVVRKFNIASNRPPGTYVWSTTLNNTADVFLKDDPDWLRYKQLQKEYTEATRGTVPPGPYQKTWPLLNFRRMLWQAAQDGSDWLAWNTSKEVQKHGTQPGIADHIYDKTLPSVAKKEARRLGLPEDSVKRISIGKSNDSLTKGWDDKLKEHFITSSDPETGPEIMESLEYLDDNVPKMGDALRKVLSKKEYEGLVAYQYEFRKARKKYRVLENLPAKDWTDEHDRIMDDYYVEGGKLSSLIEELDLVNRLGLRSGGNSWGLRLTPEARKKILEEGLPKFMIPATVGAGALAKKDEKPVN